MSVFKNISKIPAFKFTHFLYPKADVTHLIKDGIPLMSVIIDTDTREEQIIRYKFDIDKYELNKINLDSYKLNSKPISIKKLIHGLCVIADKEPTIFDKKGNAAFDQIEPTSEFVIACMLSVSAIRAETSFDSDASNSFTRMLNKFGYYDVDEESKNKIPGLIAEKLFKIVHNTFEQIRNDMSDDDKFGRK